MAYKEISTSFVNTDWLATQYEFSRCRRVLVVPVEFIKYEIGIDCFELTPASIEHLESELRLRQHLKSDDIVKAVDLNSYTECVRFYLINQNYSKVEIGAAAPEEFISF